MSFDIWNVVSTILGAIWTFTTTGWDTAKVITVLAGLCTIGSTGFGLYLRFRASGARLVQKMKDYTAFREARLVEARTKLDTAADRPSPARPVGVPLFPRDVLERTLSQMKLGKVDKAENTLKDVLIDLESRAEIAAKNFAELNKEKALTHLMLGALAASATGNVANAAANRAKALGEFNSVLELDGDDVDALQYAGLILLQMSNATGALDKFNRLIAALGPGAPSLQLARAYRLQASAYLALPAPTPGNANAALNLAVANFPVASAPVEGAEMHEQQGDVRKGLGFTAAANLSFQTALTLFHGHAALPGAADGVKRVTAKIVEMNRVMLLNGAGPATPADAGDGPHLQLPPPPQTNGRG